jgi:putative transcriptional regulator
VLGDLRNLAGNAAHVVLMLHSIYTTSVARKSRDEPGEQVQNRIAEIREGLGVSRQEFADAIGVHYQTVGYLERGEYNPSLVLALRIGAALKHPIESLFSLTDLPKLCETPATKGSK